jgi:hypothetical protein
MTFVISMLPRLGEKGLMRLAREGDSTGELH